jgi:hypothetical protein
MATSTVNIIALRSDAPTSNYLPSAPSSCNTGLSRFYKEIGRGRRIVVCSWALCIHLYSESEAAATVTRTRCESGRIVSRKPGAMAFSSARYVNQARDTYTYAVSSTCPCRLRRDSTFVMSACCKERPMKYCEIRYNLLDAVASFIS